MTSRSTKLSHATVRLTGLALTSLFVVQLGYLFLEIPVALSWPRLAVIGSTLAYVILFAGVVVIWLSTRSHFSRRMSLATRLRLNFHPSTLHMLPPTFWDGSGVEEDEPVVPLERQWDDPAGKKVADPDLWGVHAIAHRLRRLHMAAGLTVIATVVSVGLQVRWLVYASAGAFLLLVVLVVATTWAPTAAAVKWLTALVPLVALALVAAGLWRMSIDPLPTTTWHDLHIVTFVIAITLGVAALGTLSAGLVTVGAITIGTLFGGSLGIGAALIAERFAGIDRITDQGAGWVAVAMILLLFTILLTAVVLSFRATPEDRTEGSLVFAVIRRITAKARIVFVAAALFGLAAGLVAVLVGCVFGMATSCDPSGLASPERGGIVYAATAIVAAVLVLAVVLRILVMRPSPLIAAGSVVGGAVAAWFIWRFSQGTLGVSKDLTVDYNDLVAVATLIIILIPTGFILRSLALSVLTKATNRKVGILWDVASFWPRWFHPLAPPGYGPKVVFDLGNEIKASRPEVLEAHSQGSVIAAVTLAQPKDLPEGMVLITYGSPMGILYRKLFPRSGIEELISTVNSRMDRRWRNLWRNDDPLGGLAIGLGESDLPVHEGSGHSGYELTKTFRDTRLGLVE
jgi:hypothetical protein